MSKRSTSSAANYLRHHAVTGPSASALVEFYGHFGFTELVAQEVPLQSYIQALSGGAWESALIVKLRNPNGDTLEIIEPVGTAGRSVEVDSAGWSHLAFTVYNCDESVRYLLGRGGVLVGGPATNPDAPFRVAYIRDPALNLIELVEALDG
ncbi:MAG: VOC family protein [Limisphaerales bacterium]